MKVDGQIFGLIVVGVLQAAFTAGIAWAVLRQVRRDVNGLGKKHERLTALLIRWADSDKKREQIARAIEGGK
ncbi:MAG: hypothetical protein ACLP1Y_04265 [Candidatus Acidiferrales bacterium]